MLDIDIEEALILKIGGKFRLTSLVQKRMVELNRGARPLVKVEGATQRQLVYEEIRQDKIVLAPREEVGYTFEEERSRIQAGVNPSELSGPGSASGDQDQPPPPEVFGSDIKKIKEQRIKELAQLLNTNTTPKP